MSPLFISTGGSLVRPLLDLLRRFLAGRNARSYEFGLRACLPTGQTGLTPRDSILPLTFLPVLLDQRLAIDRRRTFSPCVSRTWTVTWLQPRTQHQPAKLRSCQRTSVFYSYRCGSQGFQRQNISRIFNGVQPVHRPLPRCCAVADAATRTSAAFSRFTRLAASVA